MFDVLLKELAKRLNLGERASGLLAMLLALIFDEARGGYAGFLDRFRAKGQGELVTSWLGNGENRNLSLPQLESVLGTSVIEQMAARMDLSVGATGAALAQMLPIVLDKLSPDGRLPTGLSIPENLKHYLGTHADFARTAVMPEVVATQAAAKTLSHAPHARAARSSWAWLLLIPVLIAPLYFVHISTPQTPSAPVSQSPATQPPESATPVVSEPVPVTSADGVHQDGLEVQAVYNEAQLLDTLNKTPWEFMPDQPELSAASSALLEKAAQAISKAPATTRLQVAVYASDRSEAQLQLAVARATAVSTQLQAFGVPAAQLTSTGMAPPASQHAPLVFTIASN